MMEPRTSGLLENTTEPMTVNMDDHRFNNTNVEPKGIRAVVHATNADSKKTYQPYATSTLDTPLVHFMSGGMPTFYALRWMLTYPLQRRLPKLSITYGEVLLIVPWAFLVYLGYKKTFVTPEVVGGGIVAGYPLVLTFITASRTNSVFSFVFGIPFERMLFYHKFSAFVSFLLGAFHVYVAYAIEDADVDRRRQLSGGDVNPGNVHAMYGPDANFIDFATTGHHNISGSAIMLLYAAMFASSIFVIRRIAFEGFYFLHILFAIAMLGYSIRHGVNVLIVIAFWGMDVLVRAFIMAGAKYGVQRADIRRMPCDIVEVSFPKPKHFEYNAGQYMFLCFPKLSIFQWHPISISSSPHQDMVTFHIKALGNWTKALQHLADEDEVSHVSLLLDGPVGAPSVDLESDRYKLVLFVAGGVGATPLFSLCNDLLHKAQLGRDIRKICFVWSTRADKSGDRAAIEDAQESGEDALLPLPLSFTPNLFQLPCMDASNDGLVLSTPETSYSDDGLLFSECYMTNVNNDGGMSLRTGVTAGRPNLNDIFERMSAAAEDMGEKRVAVCVCGPGAMINQCKAASIKNSYGKVYFDLHSELFEF